MKASLAFFGKRAFALLDSGAWLLIALGLLMFAARIPLTTMGFVNLPVAMTVLQTAGLMFTIAGIQVMISMLVWPSLKFGELCTQAIREKSVASALIILGLMVFNGLATVAFVLWLASAMGGQVAGGV